ncbi:helix-turn-helix domain-containing protein [Desulfosarcina ovata]|uniref:helix-turn-helix domain-containing protein n=1 Tax=Desulfosarcina ovata TaxID=83564 RepID=UPI0012D31142|nr:helix-turn-helix domain-containing protein [Desulfosarcina ovata]
MSLNYKRVPAIDKCFSILSLMAEAQRPFMFFEIVKRLNLNKSTVFNILHTLNDLNVLQRGSDGLFRLGPQLVVLGKAAAEWIASNETAPLPEEINNSAISDGLNPGKPEPRDNAFNLRKRSVAYDQDTIRMLVEHSEIFRNIIWNIHLLATAGNRKPLNSFDRNKANNDDPVRDRC